MSGGLGPGRGRRDPRLLAVGETSAAGRRCPQPGPFPPVLLNPLSIADQTLPSCLVFMANGFDCHRSAGREHPDQAPPYHT